MFENQWAPKSMTEREEIEAIELGNALKEAVGVEALADLAVRIALPYEDYIRKNDPLNPVLPLIDRMRERETLGLQ